MFDRVIYNKGKCNDCIWMVNKLRKDQKPLKYCKLHDKFCQKIANRCTSKAVARTSNPYDMG